MRDLAVFLGFALLASASGREAGEFPKPAVSFSGYVDADFSTSFAEGQLKDPTHVTGLEVDLTTTVTFSPRLTASLYTTMNDGVVPAQGAGNTWDGVNFDGVTLNWLYDDKTTLYVGDIIRGTGYFNYYLNKRSAAVVGEHALRGAGFSRGGLTAATGVTDMGIIDRAATLVIDSAGDTTRLDPVIRPARWGTFVKYDWRIAPGITLSPSAKYTAGVPGATPFVGGLSFDGTFGDFTLSADAAINYHNADSDPGFTLLIEPLYSAGNYSVAAAFFLNAKGKTPIAPNYPAQTLTGAQFDDAFIYFEPGYAFNRNYAVGLPIEFHDASLDNATAQGYDKSVWLVPTLYIYPGSAAQWWIWGQVVKPATGIPGGSTALRYFAGSEVIFRF